ncbi:MAG: SIS domain-containing protein [Planctomycetota bacterium]|nr:SIS domain-containing protein [Planctomycetota bacterium]
MQFELNQRIDGAIASITNLKDEMDDVGAVIEAIAQCLHHGGTLYTCGNGGSAAQALHLAEELIGRYRKERPPFKAICLNADPTALTCIANDFGFESIFSRQCEALLGKEDVLLVLSTSGDSENLVEALEVAKEVGAKALGLLGNRGGDCRVRCDRSLVIPGDDSAHIQEAHMVMIHLICEALEEGLA